MPGLVYEIVGDATKYARSMSEAERVALGFDDSMEELAKAGVVTTEVFRDQIVQVELLSKKYGEDRLVAAQLTQQKQALTSAMERLVGQNERLTASQVRYNEASGRYQAVHGRFVAAARVEMDLRGDLLTMGVRTTAQIQEEIRQLELLQRVYQKDALVVAQLTQRKQVLVRQAETYTRAQGGVVDISGKAQGVIFNLGQAVEDFQYAGWRGAANNVTFLVQNIAYMASELPKGTSVLVAMRAALAGPAGVVMAITAVTVAVPLLIGVFERARKKAEDAKKEANGFASAIERIAGATTGAPALKALLDTREAMAREDIPVGDYEKLVQLEKALVKAAGEYLGDVNLTNVAKKYGIDLTGEENKKLDRRKTLLERQREIQEDLRAQLRDLAGEGAARLVHEEGVTRQLRQQVETALFFARVTASRPELLEAQKVLSRQALDYQEAYGDLKVDIEDLNDRLQLLRSSEGKRLAILEDQKKNLERQIELQENLNRLRAGLPTEIGPGMLRQTTPVDGVKSASEGARDSIQGMQDKLLEFQQTSSVVFGSFKSLAQSAFGESEKAARQRFEAMKAVSVAEAIVNTAVGVTKALREKNIPLAVAIGVAGAVQVAAIMSTSIGSTGGGRSGGGGPVHFGGTNAGSRADRPAAPGQSSASYSDRVLSNLTAKVDRLGGVLGNLQQRGIEARFDRGELRKGQASLNYHSELTSVRGDG